MKWNQTLRLNTIVNQPVIKQCWSAWIHNSSDDF